MGRQLRTEDMVKGGSMFCRAAYLPAESQRIFTQIGGADDLLRGAGQRSADQFAERLAHYQSELIALHPFYELNGRITRMFFDLVAIFNDPVFLLQSNVSPKDFQIVGHHVVPDAADGER